MSMCDKNRHYANLENVGTILSQPLDQIQIQICSKKRFEILEIRNKYISEQETSNAISKEISNAK